MESIKSSNFFKFNPNALHDVRQTFGLEKPGAMASAIDVLEEWLKKVEHFAKKDFDRDYLERTILRAKGSVERSKQRLDKICAAKTLLSSFFVNENVRELTHLESLEDLFLPRPTSDNYRVYFARYSITEMDNVFNLNYYKRFIKYMEYQYANDYVNGIIFLLDYRDSNLMAIIKSFNLSDLQNIFKITLECYGLKFKGLHMISTSKVIDMMVTIFRQMMSEKLGKRIYVHKTLESVYEHVDRDILPAEYGGKEKPLKELYNDFLDELNTEEFTEYIKMMNAACTMEQYRPPGTLNDLNLDVSGTFRALNVD